MQERYNCCQSSSRRYIYSAFNFSIDLCLLFCRVCSCFIVAVLVLQLFTTAHGQYLTNDWVILYYNHTLSSNAITTLPAKTLVTLNCMVTDEVNAVNGDPYWLNVTVTGYNGWVPDYYVDCSGICVTGCCDCQSEYIVPPIFAILSQNK